MQKPDFAALLRSASLKVTPKRLTLMEALWREEKPLSVPKLTEQLVGVMDEVTVYRALEALATTGIIRRVDLGHSHAYFEFEKTHHHHIVCTGCGEIEAVHDPSMEKTLHKVVRTSKRFTNINSHTMEFFGSCVRCATHV